VRAASAVTSYKRHAADDGSMRAITPAEVIEALSL
jgi:hypothetical protein